jgi:hypothetical protein
MSNGGEGLAAQSLSGYLHPAYAASLAEFGRPRALPRSGAWLLERQIPAAEWRDAMACYPLLACREWGALADDLDDLGGDLVAVSAVTDPFLPIRSGELARAFPDILVPFKEHFIVDLSRRPVDYVSEHHRRYARRAKRELIVEPCTEPKRAAPAWQSLYACLVRRHRLRGMRAFSPAALAAQLEIPGAVLLQARTESHGVVGMTLWLVSENRSYYHLGACNDTGYKLRALFGLFSVAIEYFADSGLRWLGLGGGAGVEVSPMDGLARFKRGWSTATLPVYFCGRILDPASYRLLSERTRSEGSRYFPSYRCGEFS